MFSSPEASLSTGRQLNLYSYAANNPTTLADRSGLWSTEAHNWLLESAFGDRLTQEEIRILQVESRKVDKRENQTTARSFMHSIGQEGLTREQPVAEREQFVRKMTETARQLAAEGRREEALQTAAWAMHTRMDQTSPVHVDANGDLKVWSYLDTSVATHGASEYNPFCNECVRHITAEIEVRNNRMLNEILDRVFSPPPKQEEKQEPPPK